MLSRFPGLKVLQSKNGDVPVSVLDGKTVMVYFSAHWCPPCRAFTPQLAKFYQKHSKDKNFEIIFASWDQSKAEFDEYYKEHPWLAFPYETSKQIVEQLGNKHQIRSIPTLLVFGPDGNLITREGRMSVVRDANAAEFPWANADAAASSSSTQKQFVVIGVLFAFLLYKFFLS